MKRVLFVDDDASLLDALSASLSRYRDKWHPTFVESGPRALVELELQPFDVVVTDMRMPAMDGAQLLRIVSERWPETIRIVLSGQADLEHTRSLVPVAHQFLNKPCDVQQIENRIERCLGLHELLRRPELRAVVGRIRTLPAIPRTYSMLRAVMADEKTTAAEVAKIISADTVIAAKVLQLVNSAFFGLGRRITNIQQAVSFLGFTAISNVVLSAEVFSRWSGHATPSMLDFERLQLHARTVAVAGHALVAKTALADDTVLAGLLHDIGYWVLAQECPAELDRALEIAATQGVPLYDAEAQVIGASHAEIGAYLLGLWGLPYPVVEAVAHHHAPQRVVQTELDVLAATVVAHSLSGLGDSSAFNVTLVPDAKVTAVYLENLHAPFDWAEAERRVKESLAAGESMF